MLYALFELSFVSNRAQKILPTPYPTCQINQIKKIPKKIPVNDDSPAGYEESYTNQRVENADALM